MDNVRKNQYTGFNSNITKYTRKLRKNMTKQERHLWYDFLRKYPIKIYRQRSIDCYIVDFYCSQANLVIEIDGGQHYTEEGIAYDQKRTAAIEKYNLKVIRFSNREIDIEFDGVCWKIDQIIQTQIEKRRDIESLS